MATPFRKNNKLRKITVFCKFRESDKVLLSYTKYAPANECTEARETYEHPDGSIQEPSFYQ